MKEKDPQDKSWIVIVYVFIVVLILMLMQHGFTPAAFVMAVILTVGFFVVIAILAGLN